MGVPPFADRLSGAGEANPVRVLAVRSACRSQRPSRVVAGDHLDTRIPASRHSATAVIASGRGGSIRPHQAPAGSGRLPHRKIPASSPRCRPGRAAIASTRWPWARHLFRTSRSNRLRPAIASDVAPRCCAAHISSTPFRRALDEDVGMIRMVVMQCRHEPVNGRQTQWRRCGRGPTRRCGCRGRPFRQAPAGRPPSDHPRPPRKPPRWCRGGIVAGRRSARQFDSS